MEKFNAAKYETNAPIMYPFISSLFAKNAATKATDIIREFSFMQCQTHIKDCDVEIKIIYCLDVTSTAHYFKYHSQVIT